MIIRPVFFIIFIAALCFIDDDIGFASADVTTVYVFEQNFSEVVNFLESIIADVFKWCQQNGLIANFSKRHFLISQFETKSTQIQNSCIKASTSEKLPLEWKLTVTFNFS